MHCDIDTSREHINTALTLGARAHTTLQVTIGHPIGWSLIGRARAYFTWLSTPPMPACGQAVICGVCDTPELWRGAARLCARVRACAGAAESLHTYIHTLPTPTHPGSSYSANHTSPPPPTLSPYKILFHFKALLWRANHPFIAPPHLQSLPYCNTIARPFRNMRAPPPPPLLYSHTPYNIDDGNIV